MRCGRLARMKPDHTANAQLLVIALGIDAAHRLLAMRGRGAGRAIRARARVIADRRGPAERVIAARRRPSPTVRVIAVGTGSHWGRLRRIGVGNLPAPILGSLPQCPFPCPAATLQYPFPCPAAAFPSPKSSPRTWEWANAGAGPVVGYRSRLWRRNSFYFRSDTVARTEKPPGPRAPEPRWRTRRARFHSDTDTAEPVFTAIPHLCSDTTLCKCYNTCKVTVSL